jgi:YHS domain-containing protein
MRKLGDFAHAPAVCERKLLILRPLSFGRPDACSVAEAFVTFGRGLFLLPLMAAVLAAPVFAASSDEKVKKTDAKYVCFMNKQHFDSPQKKVEVNGKTYYGCCEHCLEQLKDPKSHLATDPVSGKQVDMADAVIGYDKSGKVYFFENNANLKKFRVASSATNR